MRFVAAQLLAAVALFLIGLSAVFTDEAIWKQNDTTYNRTCEGRRDPAMEVKEGSSATVNTKIQYVDQARGRKQNKALSRDAACHLQSNKH